MRYLGEKKTSSSLWLTLPQDNKIKDAKLPLKKTSESEFSLTEDLQFIKCDLSYKLTDSLSKSSDILGYVMDRKKEPLIFLKIWSKYRQEMSGKFPKSFRGARNLVVLGEFLRSWKNPKNHKSDS